MELRVQIFKFHLHRVERSDLEQIKQELSDYRKENLKLFGELKLFRYYFLNFWRGDKQRKIIN